ncbi:MAG TPA: 5'-nucleotidase C-terminal domain-containing protein [Bacillota bacterium]|nr:5'-nucleotidase C-terminal domain-containing protein [Bacillota bacterium]
MKRNYLSRRLLALLLATALLLSLFTVATAEDADVTLVIFHTNDVHSRLESSTSYVGHAKISTIVQAEKDLGANVLLLDAGDAVHGQSIANLSSGAAVIEVMNAAGYDAMTPGNHDFNYGQARLIELAEFADFPILAANVLKSDGTPFLPGYIIREFDGIKVAIFGLVTPETLFKTHPKNVAGLTFVDPAKVAAEMFTTLEGQADFIIALSHLGQDGDFTSTMVAEAAPGIDLIIDGHSHDKGVLTVGETIIVQTGEYANNLGRIDITFAADGTTIEASLIAAADVVDVAADQMVLDIIAHYKEQVSAVQSIVIGSTAVHLEGDRAFARTTEINLGNLITDAMLKLSGADLALTNGGGIRASIPIGEITRKHVFDVLPFGNLIVVKEVTGQTIMDMLEFSSRLYPAQNGGFLQAAGITYKIDAAKDPLARVHSVMIAGKPLDLSAKYLLATNDFVAAGGDGYAMLADYPIHTEMVSLEESLAEYITSLGANIAPALEGRIAFAPTPLPAPVPEPLRYTVKFGDRLWRIARSYGTTWEVLWRYNNLANPHMIFPNQVILIPPAG